MYQENSFDLIRPYNNNEVKGVIEHLLQEPHFQKVLSVVYPKRELSEIMTHLRKISTVKEFQKEVVYYYLRIIIDKTINKLSFSGLDQLDPSKKYLFISNHRDIILDSALLNVILFENKIKTTEIAIGSNLLIFPWIEMLVKLNKSFVVRRNLPVKETLLASKELSAYIQYTLLEKKNSVWIAQKEGRTKDGDDGTHSGLLKMIHMSSNQSVADYYKALKMVPVSISYEVEPCDKAKTTELYTRLRDGSYVKDPKEDLLSMSGGLNNFKGRVHFHFGKVLNEELNELNDIHFKNDQYVKLAQIVDKSVHEGFKLFEGSYIAYDILSKTTKFADKYTKAEYQSFCKHVNENIADIEGDKDIIKRIFLGIYANPLINKFKLEKIPVEQEV
ncbi:MAG: 1-acyl-sn-glycerol-3-phosphate acyltransferase [Bacteroidales bacterium]|nr:1-acyl-sn-glycerol-3-phosphate acyltransferase [Bacteroidales bacterium]